ncbi:MAG: hypothetical protein M1819_001058 [Sarea resinae]|nr:MAG: hypothetical protein M1819_001058 [Sarea resinae]
MSGQVDYRTVKNTGILHEVAAGDFDVLAYGEDGATCIGTQHLDGCSAIMIISQRGALLALIPPYIFRDQERMLDVANLYNACYLQYFMGPVKAYVFSAIHDGLEAVAGQGPIIDYTLRRIGLFPHHCVYRTDSQPFTGRGTVFVDGRGAVPLVYLEAEFMGTNLSSIP